MELSVSNFDFIVNNGGSRYPDAGHRSHFPVFVDAEGNEYIYIDGQRPIEIGQTGLKGIRQEVSR